MEEFNCSVCDIIITKQEYEINDGICDDCMDRFLRYELQEQDVNYE